MNNDPRTEAAILKHYRLQDPFPTTWSDPIEDAQAKQRKQFRQSTSRYSVLQEEGSSSTLKNLVGDLYSSASVPEDEPDPLGTTDSVVRVLRKKGLPVEDNARLRNKYLVSSKHFTPSAFLRDVHATTPSPVLQQGLSHLSKSIAQKSGSLKVLVETNFDRFVAAKATIEGVYREMKDTGFLSKDKESEFGVGKIRAYLNEAGSKADDVFGPIMAGRGREEALRFLLTMLDKHGSMLDIPVTLLDAVRRKDNEVLLEEYQKGRKYLIEARTLVPNPSKGFGMGVKEEHIHQLVLTERMWLEVEAIIDDFKRDTWTRLLECKTEDPAHMELIGILLEVGVEENPITLWLDSRYHYLRERISTVFERARMEVEIVRRKVAASPVPKPHIIANHLRAASKRGLGDAAKAFDTPAVNTFWEVLNTSLTLLLDSNTGVFGEVLNFWKSAQSFLDGENMLPGGIDQQSVKHHRLTDDEAREIHQNALELVSSIRDCMVSFFQDKPIEDVSAMYPALPTTPLTPTFGDSMTAPPIPQPPKMTGQDDDYAFFPPGANSLGAVYFLGKAMLLLGTAASTIAERFAGLGRANQLDENLRSMLSVARERMVTAICAAWYTDSQNCKYMEDWQRSTENRGVTRMPSYVDKFEKEIISGLQSIIYLDHVRTGNRSIISPPSIRLLDHVRNQFNKSLYTALEGMVLNTKRPHSDSEAAADPRNSLLPGTTPPVTVAATTITANSVHAEDRNVRMLLTLSNLQLLKSRVAPDLIAQFEASFSVNLNDESKKILNVLSQINDQLFNFYTAPLCTRISSIVSAGVGSPSWSPPPGEMATEVRPYVYEALLLMVEVHAQVSTTAPGLIMQIMQHLLKHLSNALLEAFKKREKFTLAELLQATLDVEFVNQTLAQYATPEASDAQQKVYVELDRGSDAQAREGLQGELQGMKGILSALRKSSRAEFLCFRAKRSGSRRTAGSETR